MLQRRAAPEIRPIPEVPERPVPRPSRWTKIGVGLLKVLLPLAVLAAAVAGYLWLQATRPAVPTKPVREIAQPVRAVPVAYSTHRPTLTLYGTAVAGRSVEMRALVAGEVIEVSPELRDGGEIARGAKLLRIEPFDYRVAVAQARAQLAEAKARLAEFQAAISLEEAALRRAQEQLAIAVRDLERAEPLVRSGALSEKVADERRLAVSQRREAVEQRANSLQIQKAKAEQQRAAIDRLEWVLKSAERDLADTTLFAPFDAYVSNVDAEVGKIVGVNDRVATLFDRNWIEVRFTLTDAQFGRLIREEEGAVGREIEVRWYLGDKPVVYKGRIVRIGAEVPSASGGVNVYGRVLDPREPTPLRPGAFVEVRVPDITYKNVARLPESALYGNDRVYVIRDGRLNERKVKVVGAGGGDVLLRGDLKEGERVMVTRLSKPGEGIKVVEHGRSE